MVLRSMDNVQGRIVKELAGSPKSKVLLTLGVMKR